MSGWAEQVAARTMAQECRGEPLEGQQAVAWVLRNRRTSGRWGKSLATVCLWRAQFSGWLNPADPNFVYACNLADDDHVLTHMLAVLGTVLSAPADADPTNGATHYYAPAAMVPPGRVPPWVSGATPCGKFGHQLFYRNVK